jgi:hypothetical protein
MRRLIKLRASAAEIGRPEIIDQHDEVIQRWLRGTQRNGQEKTKEETHGGTLPHRAQSSTPELGGWTAHLGKEHQSAASSPWQGMRSWNTTSPPSLNLKILP